MTIENNNEDSNVKNNKPKRSTISLKKSVDVSGGRTFSSAHSKTVEVEVKRKKMPGIRIDVTGSSPAKSVDGKSASIDLKNLSDSSSATGKLTDQEFQARVKVLQDAMKHDQEEQNRIHELELASAPPPVEAEPQDVDETPEEPIVSEPKEEEAEKVVESKSRFQTQKKKEPIIIGGSAVVFKSSDYVRPSEKTKPSTVAQVNEIKAPVKEPVKESVKKPETTVQKVREFTSTTEVTQSDPRKKSNGTADSKAVKTFVKKADANKKVSRAVLHRVLDNDLEERARSLASFKRAKQKLKNSVNQQDLAKVVRDVNIPDMITVSELANRMAVRGAEVVKYLMKIGTMATINQTIDGDTAEIICAEFGHKPNRISESDIENEIQMMDDAPDDLVTRAPIVAIMGHVDHGKTTLLDTLRKTNVAGKEAGGITQHVAAYQVESSSGKKITFIDTPGHAAFSKIRSRGAVITDIIVLVVAADDGIKDQTKEAISHAKSQNVPIVVAINKIDKPNINIDRIKTDLMNHEIVLEDFGGDVLSSEISALKNINLNGLIDTILLQAEMMQLNANPNRKAVGTVLETQISRGKGIVASAIIQHGTLKPGDIFVAGGAYGKVRTIYDDKGKKLNSAGPSTPIEIVGFNNAAEPGDIISVMDSEQKAREIAEYRKRVQKDQSMSADSAMTIDQMMAGQSTPKRDLNILVKADVYGSLEALIALIKTLAHEEIDIKVTESGVGMINESDIDFAKHTKSLVIGFNIGITSVAKDSAKLNGVKVFTNSVIYHIVTEIKREMSLLLPPIIEENYIGTAEVRKIFSISRYGTIAGCYVIDGCVKRNDTKIKVMRDGKSMFEGKIRSMKHEKDEIKESKQSHECGILAEGFNEFKEGDKIECYEIVQKARYVE